MRRRDLDAPDIEAALQEFNVRSCNPPLSKIEVQKIFKSVTRCETGSMETTPLPLDPAVLLEVAKNANSVDRPAALCNLANSLQKFDLFTVTFYADQVKAAGLCNKDNFLQGVMNAQKNKRTRAESTRSGTPTDDELGARWLAQYPNTAYGLGEFRRYEGGIWPALTEDLVKMEVAQVLEKAKAEGIRPTKGRLESVLELARVGIAIPNE